MTDTQTPEGAPGAPAESAAPAAPTDWRSALPEELRAEKSLESFKGKDWSEVGPTIAKSFVEGQRLIGGSITRLPGKDAKPEEVTAWKQANLGKLAEAGLIDVAPASPDKYEFKVPTAIGTLMDDKTRTGFAKVLHENGVSSKAAQAILDWYGTSYGEGRAVIAAAARETEAQLKGEWGAAYDRNLGLAQRTVIELGGKAALDVFESTGLGNHPAILKMFARVGALLAEDGAITTDMDGGVPSESDAKTKLAAIKNDRAHAYWNREHPGHKDAVEEMRRLHELAFPVV
jgi:hypothetical protein